MIVGLSFICCSLLYLILLCLVYFSKNRLGTIETKLYDKLLVLNILGLVLELCSCFTVSVLPQDSFINIFVTRAYLIYFATFISLFTLYIYIVCQKIPNLSYNKEFKFTKNENRIMWTIYSFLLVAVLILPLNYYYDKEMVYSYGPATNILLVAGVLYMIFDFIIVGKNIKKINKKKLIPLIVLFILFSIVVVIRNLNPGIILITSCFTFVTSVMFFTIENPDLKIIEELSKMQDVSTKVNNEKTNFLYTITDSISSELNHIERISNNLKKCQTKEEMLEEVEKLEQLISNQRTKIKETIDVSEFDSKHIKIVDTKYNVRNVINSTILKIKEDIKPGVDLRINISEEIPKELYGDSIKMRQIILTLLENAIKHTDKGFIEFNVTSIIKYDICRLIITLEDSGKGIDIIKQNEILSNHEDLTDNDIKLLTEDNILNLKIIRKIVNLVGGTLYINSKEEGSLIQVTINQKVVEEEKNKTSLMIENNINFIKNKKTIALITENKDNIKTIKKAIKKYDYILEIFDITLNCLNNIRNGLKYDYIIIDENMDKIDSYSLYNKLKQIEFNGKILVIASRDNIDKKKQILEYGFDGVLPNVVTIKSIINLL